MVNNIVFEEFLEISDIFLHNKNMKEATNKLINDLCNLLGIEKLLFGIKKENDEKGTPIVVYKKFEGVSFKSNVQDFEFFIKTFTNKKERMKHVYLNLFEDKKYKTKDGELDGLQILESLSYDVPYDAEPSEYFLSYLDTEGTLSYIIAERIGVKFTNSEFKMLSIAFRMLSTETTKSELEKKLSNESKVHNYVLNNEKMPICMISKDDQRILEYNDYYEEVLPNIVNCTYYYELIGRDKDFRIDNYLFIYIGGKHWIKKIFSLTLDNGEEVYIIYAKDTEEHIKQLENIDLLTTGLSLKGLEAYYDKTICTDNNKYALMTLDICKFKTINSKYGFEKGNDVLCEICNILYVTLKNDEMFCRINDDKFAMLIKLNKLAKDTEKEKIIISRYLEIEDKFRNLKKNNTILKNMTMYFGACLIDKTLDFTTLIDRATMARKQVKSEKNNKKNIAIYDSEVEELILKEHFIEERTPYAIENDEFALYLQPNFDIFTKKLLGCEALLRWVAYDEIIFFPDEFIPLFEKNGFIKELDFIMIEKIIEYISNNIKDELEVMPISINISKIHITNKEDFLTKITSLTDKYEVPKDIIEFEIAGDIFLQNEDAMVEFINLMKSNNIKICIDNFGKLYSSINLLSSVDIDALKIDRSFLYNLDSSNSEKGTLLLKNIVNISKDLNFEVICSGIETENQINMLKSIGCKVGQGYIFEKPLKLEDFQNKYILKN